MVGAAGCAAEVEGPAGPVPARRDGRGGGVLQRRLHAARLLPDVLHPAVHRAGLRGHVRHCQGVRFRQDAGKGADGATGRAGAGAGAHPRLFPEAAREHQGRPDGRRRRGDDVLGGDQGARQHRSRPERHVGYQEAADVVAALQRLPGGDDPQPDPADRGRGRDRLHSHPGQRHRREIRHRGHDGPAGFGGLEAEPAHPDLRPLHPDLHGHAEHPGPVQAGPGRRHHRRNSFPDRPVGLHRVSGRGGQLQRHLRELCGPAAVLCLGADELDPGAVRRGTVLRVPERGHVLQRHGVPRAPTPREETAVAAHRAAGDPGFCRRAGAADGPADFTAPASPGPPGAGTGG